MPSTFSRDTDPEPDPDVPGRFRAAVTADWNAPVFPHGGITSALAVRAMQRLLARPDQVLRSVHVVFVARIPVGKVTLDAEVLRVGRTMSHTAVTLHNADGGVGLTATAVFGAARPGFAFTDAVMPESIPPLDAPLFDHGPKGPSSLWQRMEGRAVTGHPPDGNFHPTTSEQVNWYRFAEPPLQPDGTLDPLACLVLGDTMPGAVHERMGGGVPRWYAPSADLTLRVLGPVRGPWVLSQVRAHRADDGYVSLENRLWDPESRSLVAVVTQLALFVFPHDEVTGTLPAPN